MLYFILLNAIIGMISKIVTLNLIFYATINNKLLFLCKFMNNYLKYNN